MESIRLSFSKGLHMVMAHKTPLLSIELPAQPYYPGGIQYHISVHIVHSIKEEVSGFVVLNSNTKKTRAYAIRVTLSLREECTWKERGASRELTKFEGSATVFEQTLTLWGNTTSSGYKNDLPKERQQFPFSFTIPVNAPPTLTRPKNGFKGTITCELSTYLDCGSKKKNQVSLKLQILNYFVPIKEAPKPVTVSKRLGKFFNKSTNPIVVSSHLEKTIVISGEEAGLIMDIDNNTSKNVRGLNIDLVRAYEFTATNPYHRQKHFEESIATYCFPPAEKKKEKLVTKKTKFKERFPLKIPPGLTPSNFPAQTVSLTYKLQMAIFTDSQTLYIQLPMIISSPNPRKQATHSFYLPMAQIAPEYNPENEPKEVFDKETQMFVPVSQISATPDYTAPPYSPSLSESYMNPPTNEEELPPVQLYPSLTPQVATTTVM